MEKDQTELTEVVEMVLQFLTENNFVEAYKTLSNESGVYYNKIQQYDKFRDHWLNGNWNYCLRQLNLIRLPNQLTADIYQLLIFELVISREYDIAQMVIKDQHSLFSLFPETLEMLWEITQIREPPQTELTLFKEEDGIQKKRQALLSKIEAEVSQNAEENRLLKLIGQAKAQQFQPRIEEKIVPVHRSGPENKEIFITQGVTYAQRIAYSRQFQTVFLISTVLVSNGGKYLVLGGKDGLIEVWDFAKMQLDRSLSYQNQDQFMIHKKGVLSLCFSKDDKILASGDQEGVIKVWKFESGKQLKKIDNQGGANAAVTCILLTYNNSHLLAGSLKNTIKIFGLKSGNMLKELVGHSSFVLYMNFIGSNDTQVFSCDSDAQMIIWNSNEGDPKHQIVKQIHSPLKKQRTDTFVNNVQLNPNNPDELLICHKFSVAFLVSIEKDAVKQHYSCNSTNDNEEMLYACFSSCGKYVYGYSGNKTLYIFDKVTGKLLSFVEIPFEMNEILGLKVSQSPEDGSDNLIAFSEKQMFKLIKND